MIDTIKSHYKKFRKFCAVGVINTIIDFSIFYILYEIFGFYYLIAHICSFSIAVVNSFIINAVWTFKSFDLNEITKQLPKFFIVAVGGLLISSLVIYILTSYINVYLAKVLSSFASLFWNYLGSLFFVFKKKKD